MYNVLILQFILDVFPYFNMTSLHGYDAMIKYGNTFSICFEVNMCYKNFKAK